MMSFCQQILNYCSVSWLHSSTVSVDSLSLHSLLYFVYFYFCVNNNYAQVLLNIILISSESPLTSHFYTHISSAGFVSYATNQYLKKRGWGSVSSVSDQTKSLMYSSFVCFWPVKFSSRRLGKSHLYRHSNSAFTDETKQVPCHHHLLY